VAAGGGDSRASRQGQHGGTRTASDAAYQ
jgi:hypothetical protein